MKSDCSRVRNPDYTRAHNLLGSSKGGRPVIRIKKDSPAFLDRNRPRAMLLFRLWYAKDCGAVTKNPPPENPLDHPPDHFKSWPDYLFDSAVRSLDFDLNGHGGAIGVSFPAAQDSSVVSVRIDATGGYAGFYGIPGAGGGAADIEVEGGEYGILMPKGHDTGCAVAAGARLFNQRKAAVETWGYTPFTLVGFEVVKRKGPVFKLQDMSRSSFGSLTLYDGTILLSSGGDAPAIDNGAAKNLYVRNVHVKGTSRPIYSGGGGGVSAADGGDWTPIEEYVFTDQWDGPAPRRGDRTFATFSMVEGSLSRAPEPSTVVGNGSPTAEEGLVERHLWRSLPFYEGSGTEGVNVLDYKATPDDEGDDDAPAIQAAIDKASSDGHGVVFIPAGTFHIKNTLHLRSNTRLFGAGRVITRIRVHRSWEIGGEEVPLITTADDREATTFLGFLSLDLPKSLAGGPRNRFNLFHWKAGRNSVTINIRQENDWVPQEKEAAPRTHYLFSGGGGGKHYFLRPTHGHHNEGSPGYRGVRIEGTTEPLIFYSFNSEAGKVSGNVSRANMEIARGKNIRIFGYKREGQAPMVVIRGGENIGFFSAGAMRRAVPRGYGGLFQVLGGGASAGNIVLANILVQQATDPPNGEALLRESLSQSEHRIDWPEGLSLYRRGSLDDKAVFGRP